MGKALFAVLCIGLSGLAISCSDDSGGDVGPSGGSTAVSTGGANGGASGSSTATASGGKSATGGSASGGSSASSGGVGSGGSSASGGKTGSGGAVSTGGATASGGATSSGGVGAGGATTTVSKGGAGGGTSVGSGGTSRSGGTTGAGGGTTSPTDGYPLGNPAVPSSGCGKALSTFKAGSNTSHKMNSAGINNREYIIYIPSNYDPQKPYRLVFGMHCMGSSANQCANSEGFYRLKPLDTGNTTIFVAPQGYTDSMPWRTGKTDDKDHVFFDDMLKLFKSELCIDESRVFSIGFSFGAMFTNALAQTHQSVLRAVTVYATADYNIYFPANTGKPLAYMGVHGKNDPTCPFSSGKSSIERFVKNNKCTGTPKEATGNTHEVFDYTCPSNYPVKWATHTGQHTDMPTDSGQSKAWTPDLTWKWITQF